MAADPPRRDRPHREASNLYFLQFYLLCHGIRDFVHVILTGPFQPVIWALSLRHLVCGKNSNTFFVYEYDIRVQHFVFGRSNSGGVKCIRTVQGGGVFLSKSLRSSSTGRRRGQTTAGCWSNGGPSRHREPDDFFPGDTHRFVLGTPHRERRYPSRFVPWGRLNPVVEGVMISGTVYICPRGYLIL